MCAYAPDHSHGRQIGTVDLHNPSDCGAKFRSNAALGGVVFAAATLGRVMS
jgi:hypothetical protein